MGSSNMGQTVNSNNLKWALCPNTCLKTNDCTCSNDDNRKKDKVYVAQAANCTVQIMFSYYAR